MATRKPTQKKQAPTIMGQPGARLRTSKNDLPSAFATKRGKPRARKHGPDPAPNDQLRAARQRKTAVDREAKQTRAATALKRSQRAR